MGGREGGRVVMIREKGGRNAKDVEIVSDCEERLKEGCREG